MKVNHHQYVVYVLLCIIIFLLLLTLYKLSKSTQMNNYDYRAVSSTTTPLPIQNPIVVKNVPRLNSARRYNLI